MGDELGAAPKRRLNAHAREVRCARILARLREGFAYDEIARDERLTAERVRQIVREALERRLPDEDTGHAKLQLARIQPAMRVAAAAIEEGDVTAIAPLLKVACSTGSTATRRPPRSTRSMTTARARSCSRSSTGSPPIPACR